MADEKFAAGTVGRFEDPVAAFDGDGHGFFQIDSFAGFQCGNGHFFVEIVRGGDMNGTDGFYFKQIPVIGKGLCFREFVRKFVKGFL